MKQSGKILAGALLFCIAGLSNLYAQNIRIEGTDPKGQLVVTVEESSLGNVLLQLGTAFKFSIEGLENDSDGSQFSASYSGTLDKILLRLLKNRNHMIVRSTKNASGIARIVIIDNSSGDDPDTIPATGKNPFLPGITRNPEK